MGARIVGKAAVREGLAGRFNRMPDVHYGDETHFVAGDTGISKWTVTEDESGGKKIRVNGWDFYTFRAGRVVKKDSYWKILDGLRSSCSCWAAAVTALLEPSRARVSSLHSCEFFVFGAKIRQAFLLGKVTREWRSLVLA
jgi:hypothetical protein